MRSWGHQISSLRVIGLLWVVLTGVLVGAPVAGAEIVYATGGGAGIYVAHDDGSQAHQLISVTQVPGMNSIGAPAVAINNDPTLMFTGTTDAYQSTSLGLCGSGYPCDTSYDGIQATGVYKLQNGTLTRLSGAAGPCAAGCSSYSQTPQPTGDGNYFFDAWACAGTIAYGDFQCSGSIYRGSTAGGADTMFEPNCSTEFSQHATPNPVNSAQIAYDGCPASGSDLEVSGASGAGDVVLASAPSSASITFKDPSWRPDGGQVIAYQGGQDESGNPGIYAYNPSGGTPTLVLGAPLDPSGTGGTNYPYVFSDPRYIGSAKIMFSTDGNLYTIPASCVGCSFPADATQLISGATEASWTSQVIDASSGGGGGGGGGGGATVPMVTAFSLSASAFPAAPSGPTVVAARTFGTIVSFKLSTAAAVKFSVQHKVPGHKKGKRCVKKGTGKRCMRTVTLGSFTVNGIAGNNHFRFTGRLHGHKLPRGNYTLVLIATDTAGQSKSHSHPFRIIK